MSAGRGALKDSGSPRDGMRQPSSAACSAWRRNPSSVGAQRVRGTGRIAAAGAIDRIPHHRVTDVRQVHADLMGPPGRQLRQHLGMSAEALHDPHMGHRLAAIGAHRHLGAGGAMPADGLIDGAAAGQHPQAHRHIAALDLPRRQRRHQRAVGFDRPRHDHQAAGVLVQPVDQAGPRHQGQLRVQPQQGVLQRPGRDCRPRDARPPRRAC